MGDPEAVRPASAGGVRRHSVATTHEGATAATLTAQIPPAWIWIAGVTPWIAVVVWHRGTWRTTTVWTSWTSWETPPPVDAVREASR